MKVCVETIACGTLLLLPIHIAYVIFNALQLINIVFVIDIELYYL